MEKFESSGSMILERYVRFTSTAPPALTLNQVFYESGTLYGSVSISIHVQ